MAFTAAGGWTNLPNGVWSPTIYSKRVLKAFRKKTVAEDITNTDFSGEVSAFGDSVKIIQEPDITIAAYTRGQALVTQPLSDSEVTLTITKANQFQFGVDDIEKKHAHLNWTEMATSRAAYKLSDAFDSEVLSYITTAVPTAQKYGGIAAAADLIDCGFDSGEVTPNKIMNRLKRYLDELNVPEDNRWLVASPRFWEVAGDEDSKLLNSDYTSGSENLMRNGRVHDGTVAGFKLYRSNNAVTGSVSGTTYYTVLAGHKSAVATVSQLAQVESFRSHDFFGDVVRGMHLYGRNVIRSESLVLANIKID